MLDARAHALLVTWFGTADLHAPIDAATRAAWFRSDPAFDERLRADFGDLIVPARDGALAAWEASDAGTLALMLLLDQLPRNLFRGSGESFASDAQAVGLADRAIARGVDDRMSIARRPFLYLPYEHAEDLAEQDKGIARFESLVAAAGPEDADWAATTLDYARRHRALIDRFGRFPHRNAMLGRESTPAEVELLTNWTGF